MDFNSLTVAALLGGYVLGSIPFGLFIAKLGGQGDVRAIGSGNIGATNVLRTGRKDLAALTLLFDAGKAALALNVAGPGISGKTIWQAVGLGDHLFLGRIRIDQCQRAERFLVHYVSIQRDFAQYGWLEELALIADPLPACVQLCTFSLCIGDKFLHRIGAARIGHRPHLGAI